jgi:hypothetical protein
MVTIFFHQGGLEIKSIPHLHFNNLIGLLLGYFHHSVKFIGSTFLYNDLYFLSFLQPYLLNGLQCATFVSRLDFELGCLVLTYVTDIW